MLFGVICKSCSAGSALLMGYMQVCMFCVLILCFLLAPIPNRLHYPSVSMIALYESHERQHDGPIPQTNISNPKRYIPPLGFADPFGWLILSACLELCGFPLCLIFSSCLEQYSLTALPFP